MMNTTSEPTPEFLEPTPQRLRALALAFTWRYYVAYAAVFYISMVVLGGIDTVSPPMILLFALIFLEGKGIPDAVIRTLYYKPVQDFKNGACLSGQDHQPQWGVGILL